MVWTFLPFLLSYLSSILPSLPFFLSSFLPFVLSSLLPFFLPFLPVFHFLLSSIISFRSTFGGSRGGPGCEGCHMGSSRVSDVQSHLPLQPRSLTPFQGLLLCAGQAGKVLMHSLPLIIHPVTFPPPSSPLSPLLPSPAHTPFSPPPLSLPHPKVRERSNDSCRHQDRPHTTRTINARTRQCHRPRSIPRLPPCPCPPRHYGPLHSYARHTGMTSMTTLS